jgi:hypothetical protein
MGSILQLLTFYCRVTRHFSTLKIQTGIQFQTELSCVVKTILSVSAFEIPVRRSAGCAPLSRAPTPRSSVPQWHHAPRRCRRTFKRKMQSSISCNYEFLFAWGGILVLEVLPVLLRNTAARWPRHLRLQHRPAPHPHLCQQRVARPLLSRITTASWARPCAIPSRTTSKAPPRSCWSRPRCTLRAALQRQSPRTSSPRHPSAAC